MVTRNSQIAEIRQTATQPVEINLRLTLGREYARKPLVASRRRFWPPAATDRGRNESEESVGAVS